MLILSDDFPVVHLHYDRDPVRGGESPFETYERLLLRASPFVLVGHGAAQHREQGHEERKQVSLWMKRHRDALRSLVKGMVHVEPQPANRFVARSNARTYEAFWGYPMLVAPTEQDALAAAHQLLSGAPAATVDVGEDTDAARG